MFHLVYLPEIKATSEDLDVCGDVFIKTCIIFSVMYYQKKCNKNEWNAQKVLQSRKLAIIKYLFKWKHNLNKIVFYFFLWGALFAFRQTKQNRFNLFHFILSFHFVSLYI